jgi:hypothetical protein
MMVPATEAMLWDDIKAELITIGEEGDDILERWVIVGKKLRQIRKENPGYRGGTFSAAARRYLTPHGLTLTGNQMSAAQWWAKLEQKWRDKLHAEFPDALMPESLQKNCREKYPEMAKTKETHTYGSSVSKNNRKKEDKPPAPKPTEDTEEEDDDKPDTSPKPPSLKRQKEIAEEEYRKAEAEAARQDVAARRAREAEKAAKDTRPQCKEMPMPIVQFGKQVWPIEGDDYDYDQVFFGILQFYAWYDLLPAGTHTARAVTLKQRLKFLHLFVERRLEHGADKTEMRRFLQVVEMMADLYKANPTGECSMRPIDPCVR